MLACKKSKWCLTCFLLGDLEIGRIVFQYNKVYHRSKNRIRVFDNTIFKLQTPINSKICKIALGNISWNQSYWHDCLLLVIVRVIVKAITDQRRLSSWLILLEFS